MYTILNFLTEYILLSIFLENITNKIRKWQMSINSSEAKHENLLMGNHYLEYPNYSTIQALDAHK